MGTWTCSLGWFRFTVPNATEDEVMAQVGGDWIRDRKGFQGYRKGWLSRGGSGGLGRIGTDASWNSTEVHCDLSQEMIADWPYEKAQRVAHWVRDKGGKFGRIDVALDDRNGAIDVEFINQALMAGQCVTRFRQARLIDGRDLEDGSGTGKTLCLGSRQSDSYLRIYDKAAEQKAKGRPVEGTWVRWEMEWKDDRADAVGLALSTLPEEDFRRHIVGVFRSAIDFRDCNYENEPMERYRAPLLPWWEKLTEAMSRARLQIEKVVAKIEDLKRWTERALAPTLGLLCAHPEAGERWLVKTIVDGVERWRAKHFALLANEPEVLRLQRQMRFKNSRDGFSAVYAAEGT